MLKKMKATRAKENTSSLSQSAIGEPKRCRKRWGIGASGLSSKKMDFKTYNFVILNSLSLIKF